MTLEFVLSLAAVGFAFLWLREKANDRAGLCAAGFVAFCPLAADSAFTPNPDALIVCAAFLALWLEERLRYRPTLPILGAALLAMALLLVVGAYGLPIWLGCVASFLVCIGQRTRPMKILAGWGAGQVLLLGLVVWMGQKSSFDERVLWELATSGVLPMIDSSYSDPLRDVSTAVMQLTTKWLLPFGICALLGGAVVLVHRADTRCRGSEELLRYWVPWILAAYLLPPPLLQAMAPHITLWLLPSLTLAVALCLDSLAVRWCEYRARKSRALTATTPRAVDSD